MKSKSIAEKKNGVKMGRGAAGSGMKNGTRTAEKAGKGERSSVVVLPESDEHTLCVEMKGLIRKKDYERNFRNRIIEIMERNPDFNLLICYAPSYRGWEPAAADLSLKSIMELGGKIHRQACVNTPQRILFRNKLSASLFSGETRYFETAKYSEAVAWVKGGAA